MSDPIGRRELLVGAAGAGAAGAGAVAGAGTATAQEDGGETGPIDWGGYLDGANNWSGPDGTVDARGQGEVEIDVGAGDGGLAFGPAAVHVDPGTTILWTWTGEGGAHNVVADGGEFDSGNPQTDGEFEYEVPSDTSGIITYFCRPHQGQGMLGAIAVGEVPRQPAQQSLPPVVSDGARTLGVAALIAMASTLGLAYFFMKYGGDYAEE